MSVSDVNPMRLNLLRIAAAAAALFIVVPVTPAAASGSVPGATT